MESFVGVATILSLMCGLAVSARLVRRFHPAWYGRFWRSWGEVQATWLRVPLALLAGQLVVKLSNQTLAQTVRLGGWDTSIAEIMHGLMSLLVLGFGAWFVARYVWRDER